MRKPKTILESCLYFNIDMVDIKMPLNQERFQERYFLDDDGSDLRPFVENNNLEPIVTLQGVDFTYKQIDLRRRGYNGSSMMFSTVVNGKSIPAFAIARGGKWIGGKTGVWKDHSKLTIYGSLFTAIKHGFIPFDLVAFHSRWFSDCVDVTRLDICADYNATKPEILSLFDRCPKWESMQGTDPKHSDFFETYYADKLSTEKNSWHLRRIYDKKIEARLNKKVHLYPYLADFDDVQRVEIELRKGLLDTLSLKFPEVYTDDDLKSKLYQTYLSSLSSYFERFTLPKFHHEYEGIRLDYLKPVGDDYVKYIRERLATVFRDCSYKGLCQLVLQPIRNSAKYKLVRGEITEISGEKAHGKWDDRRKYRTEELQTAVDPLAFLDVYIRYLHDDLHIPVSKINKVLKRRYIKDSRQRNEYDPLFGFIKKDL